MICLKKKDASQTKLFSAAGGRGEETQPLSGSELSRSPKPDVLHQLRLLHRAPPLAPHRLQGTHGLFFTPLFALLSFDVAAFYTS